MVKDFVAFAKIAGDFLVCMCNLGVILLKMMCFVLYVVG
jgi:hypothetical protein